MIEYIKKERNLKVKPVIYIDTLFILNLTINIFIFSLSSYIIQEKTGLLKIIFVSALGALYSIFMFFPTLKFLYIGLFKLLFIVLTSFILFGFKSIKTLLKNSLICLLVSLIVCGCIWIIIGLTGFSEKNGGIISNGILYLNLNPIILLLGISLASFFSIFFTLTEKEQKETTEEIKQLSFSLNNKEYTLNVLLDTGCKLYHKSGLPIIIVERAFFNEEFWDILNEEIEYKTISWETEKLSVFLPDIIYDNKNTYKAYIGIGKTARFDTDGKFNSIMNPCVLNNYKSNEMEIL